jgi:hemerythrin-like domain-containing protein
MKRHKSLAVLSSDHHKGLNMAKLLKTAIGLPSAEINNIYKKFKEFFETELAEHFSEEETFLVPPLSNNDLIKRMCEEHKAMKEMFNKLSTSEHIGNSLAELGKLLENHIRFEERELFGMIENTLTEAELLEISNKVNSRRRIN